MPLSFPRTVQKEDRQQSAYVSSPKIGIQQIIVESMSEYESEIIPLFQEKLDELSKTIKDANVCDQEEKNLKDLEIFQKFESIKQSINSVENNQKENRVILEKLENKTIDFPPFPPIPVFPEAPNYSNEFFDISNQISVLKNSIDNIPKISISDFPKFPPIPVCPEFPDHSDKLNAISEQISLLKNSVENIPKMFVQDPPDMTSMNQQIQEIDLKLDKINNHKFIENNIKHLDRFISNSYILNESLFKKIIEILSKNEIYQSNLFEKQNQKIISLENKIEIQSKIIDNSNKSMEEILSKTNLFISKLKIIPISLFSFLIIEIILKFLS